VRSVIKLDVRRATPYKGHRKLNLLSKVHMNWRLCLPALITITAQLASWFPNQLNAAAPSESRVTRVSSSVQLLCPMAAARRASVNNTLEGTGRLYRPGHLGDSVLVGPGQMVIGNADTAVSDPVDFDINRFTKTSCFITDFPPLRSEQSIVAEGQKQQREKSKKTLINTNLVIFGGGIRVSVVGLRPTASLSRTTAAVALATPRRAPKLSPEAVPASH
jgi:hypothetical protein